MDKIKATPQAETGHPQVEVEDDPNLGIALSVLLDARTVTEQLEAKLKEAKAAEANAEQGVVALMLEQGVDNFRAMGKSVTRQEFRRYSVLAADRDKQMDWLREEGMGAMIVPSVNASTFGAWVRNEFVKAGKPLPEFVKEYGEQRLLVRSVS